MNDSPAIITDPREQTEETKPVRILLSERASQHLEAIGQDCFIVTAKDKSDERSGRWIIHLMPCSYTQANSACRVARGESKESRPRASKA